MPTRITKTDAEKWLLDNIPFIKMIKWNGKTTVNSVFFDQRRNLEFEYSFRNLKKAFSKDRNFLPCASKTERVTKQKQNLLKKYGSFKSKEAKERTRSTNLKKYGVENPFQSESVKEKIKKTLLKKYGVEYLHQNEEIKQKAIQTRIKIGDIKLIEGKTQKEFAEELNLARTSMNRVYNKHGLEVVKEYKPKSTSILEQLIKQFLKEEKIKFINNYYFSKYDYRPDFLLPDYNFIIECDGLYWHSEEFHNKEYHRNKKEYYISKGYKLLYFYEDEFQNFEDIKRRILLALNKGIIENSKPKGEFWWTNKQVRLEQDEFKDVLEAALKGFYKLWPY